MGLVFILFGIFVFLLIYTVLLLFSTLKFKINNLEIENNKSRYNSRINRNYEIILGFYILKKVPILMVKLNSKRIKKLSNNKSLERINIKKIENSIPIRKIINILKNIKIENLNLKIDIGTEDAILTSYLVAILASIIGILLPHVANKNWKYCTYTITPRYKNRNECYISLNGIFCIKIVHIIYSICIKEKKGRDKNERTSNRRAYA